MNSLIYYEYPIFVLHVESFGVLFSKYFGHEQASELLIKLRTMIEQMYKQYSKSNVSSNRGQSSVDETQNKLLMQERKISIICINKIKHQEVR